LELAKSIKKLNEFILSNLL